MSEDEKEGVRTWASYVDMARLGKEAGIETVVLVYMPKTEGLEGDEDVWSSISSTDDRDVLLKILDTMRERVVSGKWETNMMEVDPDAV